jgi:hypothetical protein
MYGSSWKIVSCYFLNIKPAVLTDHSCANLGLAEPTTPPAFVDYITFGVKMPRAVVLRLYCYTLDPRARAVITYQYSETNLVHLYSIKN